MSGLAHSWIARWTKELSRRPNGEVAADRASAQSSRHPSVAVMTPCNRPYLVLQDHDGTAASGLIAGKCMGLQDIRDWLERTGS
jgi:hypothetical protein